MGFILVEELGKEREYGLDLRLVAGKRGLQKKITDSHIQRLGLALAGFTDHVQPHRIGLLGNTELSYLKALPPKKREEIIKKICSLDISCFVFTGSQGVPKSFFRESEKASIPVFETGLGSYSFIQRATRFLEHRLSAATTVHGVLVDVFGVGVLILGRSGIGKSECALDLIMKGHRLVADDVVRVRKASPSTIIGSGFDLVKQISLNTTWRFEAWGLSISEASLGYGRLANERRLNWWSSWWNGRRIMIVSAWKSRGIR